MHGEDCFKNYMLWRLLFSKELFYCEILLNINYKKPAKTKKDSTVWNFSGIISIYKNEYFCTTIRQRCISIMTFS